MKVYIYDYNGSRKEIEITKEVLHSVLLQISGDQILKVKYSDGSEDRFDSSHDRCMNLFDYCYFVDLEDGKDFKDIECGKYI